MPSPLKSSTSVRISLPLPGKAMLSTPLLTLTPAAIAVAAAAECRGAGCGKALVAPAESPARAAGVVELSLLPTTAERFFERLGYVRAAREDAPEAIRRTREFASLCPSTAAFMVKRL